MNIFEMYSGISGKNVNLLPKERESGCYQIYPQQYSKQDNNVTLFSKHKQIKGRIMWDRVVKNSVKLEKLTEYYSH